MRNYKAIAIAVALLMATGIGCWIGYRAGECPPPDYSHQERLLSDLSRLRADSALQASVTARLEKERDEMRTSIRPVRDRVRDQNRISNSLYADSIMRDLFADPPDPF